MATDLSISHAGSGNEGLLDGLALLEDPLLLLLPSHCPVALNQELDNLQVASESCVDQGTLAVLVQVIHLCQERQNDPKQLRQTASVMILVLMTLLH